MYRSTEILLPARFMFTMAHLIATMTILFDVEGVVRSNIGKGENYGDEKDQLTILAWISVAFFIVEFLCMFAGVSIFMNNVTCVHIAAHFLGMVCVGLFIAQEWSLNSYIWWFTLFSCIPVFMELVVAFAIFQLKLLEYS